jgi:predicted enzyme related to lactoylglutathione lyase
MAIGEAYAGPVARLVGINHVALEVGDLDGALEFYGRLFEFELRGRGRGMAFLDMGDQFLALSEGRQGPPDAGRHFGLVVDDREAVRRAAEAAGAEIVPTRGLRIHDPWGNSVEVVEYGDIQFSKTDAVLEAMGLGGLEKSESARAELRKKGVET